MPDSVIDIVDPDIQGELDGLRLLVEETDGSVIAFVRYRRVTEREAGVRYLKKHLSLPVEERVLSEDRQNPLALLDNLPEERCCVQFHDLEDALPDITGYLNLNREAYAEVPHALIFWVGEHGLREVATNAPDFWAWRSGVFDVRSDEADLSQSMSQMALADDVQFTDQGDLERRAELYEGLIEEYKGEGEEYVARLQLQLSAVTVMLRNLERAEETAREAMTYAEREDEEGIAAPAYHQLGTIAEEKWQLEEAKKWYKKSLESEERQGNEHGIAKTYHQLGIVAQKQRELEEAKKWYDKALEIKERQDDEQGTAGTYHELGRLALKRGELEEAKKWCEKSLEISERRDNEYGVAKTYHQLGMIAREQRELEEARKWYEKSLEINERLGSEYGAAEVYHQLGIVAQERRKLEEAKRWYKKSREIYERLGDEHGAALTHGQLGILESEQDKFIEGGQWLLRSIISFYELGDQQGVQRNVNNFLRAFRQAPPEAREEMRAMWIDADLPENELDDFLDQVRAKKSG